MSTPTDTTTTEDQHPEEANPLVQGPPVPQSDQHGVIHVGHPAHTDCTGNCYQTPPGN